MSGIGKRRLGSTGIEVSRIGLGCVTFGREISEDESFRILDYAFEHGINLLDTAEKYGEDFASERILGRWIASRGCRKELILQSKIASEFTVDHVRDCLQGSLSRLGVDHLDLYLFHSFDPASSLETAVEAMANAIHSGILSHYGCSNFSLEQLQLTVDVARRNAMPQPAAIEPIYNLVERSAERDLFPYCESAGIGITSYSPLGAGFLTGKYTEDPSVAPPMSRFALVPGHRHIYCTPHGFRTLAGLRQVAEESGLPLHRLAMGWALQHSSITAVLVGATRVDHLRNAIEALQEPLPPDVLQRLDAISTGDDSSTD